MEPGPGALRLTSPPFAVARDVQRNTDRCEGENRRVRVSIRCSARRTADPPRKSGRCGSPCRFLFAVAQDVQRNSGSFRASSSGVLGVSIRCSARRTAQPLDPPVAQATGMFLFAVARDVQRNAHYHDVCIDGKLMFLFAAARDVQRKNGWARSRSQGLQAVVSIRCSARRTAELLTPVPGINLAGFYSL